MQKNKPILALILIMTISSILALAPFSMAADQNIVQIAVGNPNFSTLVTALTAVELVSTLEGTGPFTVFAPTNDAFANLPLGIVQYLLSDKVALSEVLTYHVVSGKSMSSDLSNNQTLTTLLGETLTVQLGDNVMINDAKVTTANIEATNGVIHIIDKVLVPQSVLNRQATVNIATATGGTTQPSGTTSHPFATALTVTATADSTHAFQNWIISQSGSTNDIIISENPLKLAAAGQMTITPVFVVPQSIPGRPLPGDISSSAIVVLLPSAGGTTNPAPGTYSLANAEKFDLTAMPSQGWQFLHWTICGPDTGHGSYPVNWSPTENPYNVNHGYGATYTYQAVFVPAGTTEPTPTHETMAGTSNEMWIIIALIIIIVVIIIAFGFLMSKRK